MKKEEWESQIESYDERRDIIIAGNTEDTINFCIHHFISTANESIEKRGKFCVALSGGSTPKAIFQGLANLRKIDWSKVLIFWSDERSVPPTNPENNYLMAMESGLASLSIPPGNIFRMQAENDIENQAKEYEKLILSKVPEGIFDLVMLGMGEDGHTASLFPKTHALHTNQMLVAANYIPQKNTWRMTLTYDCINIARHIVIYVLGKNKASMLKTVLTSSYEPDNFPVQRVGTATHKALWIVDQDAAEGLLI